MANSLKDTDLNLDNAIARLQGLLPNYSLRDEQRQFMQSVADACQAKGLTMIEGATGIGKSLGYMIPLLSSTASFTIATATRALQQQLFEETFPVALNATQSGGEINLLMGRNNYLCPRNLKRLLHEPHQQLSDHDLVMYQRIARWFHETQHGNLWLLDEPQLADPARKRVTTQAHDCDGEMCDFFKQCPFFKSRDDSSQRTITNHQLLISSVMNARSHRVVSQPSILVIDEAHLFLDRIENQVEPRLTSAQFVEITKMLKASLRQLGEDDPLLERFALQSVSIVEKVIFIETAERQLEYAQMDAFHRLRVELDEVEYFLEELAQVLRRRINRSHLLQQAYRLVQTLHDQALVVQNRVEHFGRTGSLVRSVGRLEDVRALFDAICGAFDRVLLVSGSLSLSGDFSFLKRTFGLESAHTVAIGSPFDFPTQTRALCLSDPGEGREPIDAPRFIQALEPLISEVKSLVLFTTHRALALAEAALGHTELVDVMVYRGGDSNRFLKKVAERERVVVLATKVFWQGIDFRQAGIRCVAIDRLPFAPPSDGAWEEEGTDSALDDEFKNTLLPRCGLELKQGFGRLIRHEQDRGVFVIGDPRLMSMSYGDSLRAWLPETQWVREIDELVEFISPSGGHESR